MLAGQIFGLGDLRLVELPEPVIDGARDAIVFQPELACLCGSDLPYLKEPQPRYPLAPGLSLHEMLGRVIASSGKRFRPGDRVLAVPVDQTGLFERFVLSEERAMPLDTRRPPEEMLLAQPLGTVIFAAKKLPQLLDQDVAIVGQGPMGLLWTAVCRNLGAREIIGLDRIPARLALSRKMGATRAVDVDRSDPVQAVAEATGGRMADVVVEAVGHVDQALNLCVRLTRQGGRILYFGVPTRYLDRVEWHELFFRNITVHTSVRPDFTRDFPLAMRWIGEGRIDVRPLVTHRLPLADIAEAFRLFGDPRSGAVKVQVDFPAAGG
jgi:threonine dehydrogenase-like Zn-dependent dehydrogenase